MPNNSTNLSSTDLKEKKMMWNMLHEDGICNDLVNDANVVQPHEDNISQDSDAFLIVNGGAGV